MVGVSHHQGLTCLTLDNLAENNTLTLELLQALLGLLAALPQGTRALVLRSQGAVFSYGLNLSHGAEAGAERQAQQGSSTYAALLDQLCRLPLPTLALVQGPCKAGGVGLVAACDLVLCSRAASFQLSEALLGLLPANVSPYLLRRIGEQKLLRLSLTAQEIHADYAYQIGLADYLAEDAGALDKLARGVLKQLFRCSPTALARMKTFAAELSQQSWQEQQLHSQQLLTGLLQSAESREAIASFQQGSLPHWSQAFRCDGPLVLGVEP